MPIIFRDRDGNVEPIGDIQVFCDSHMQRYTALRLNLFVAMQRIIGIAMHGVKGICKTGAEFQAEIERILESGQCACCLISESQHEMLLATIPKTTGDMATDTEVAADLDDPEQPSTLH